MVEIDIKIKEKVYLGIKLNYRLAKSFQRYVDFEKSLVNSTIKVLLHFLSNN
jgi:hypothetical protein